MISFSLHDIAPVINAERVGTDQIIHTVSTDSRTIGEKCLFVALKGNQFDAHDFVNQDLVATALLVDHRLPLDVPQLVVDDTRRALGKLGAWVRQQVKTRIVAITGSSGKTTVKEMTASILRQCGQVLATPGNFNNDIGVALTLLRLTPQDNFAVIELGANHQGEIAWTTALVRPETALVNNLFASHLSGFGSIEKMAQSKGEIFSGLPENGLVILNADSHDWSNWKSGLGNKEVWRFSLQQQATNNKGVEFFSSNMITDQQGAHFVLHSPQGHCQVSLPLLGRHNVANALAASTLALSVGATFSEITAGLSQLEAMPGRLFSISLGSGQLLLDDSYNANVGSMTAAVQILKEMPGYRVMVVGDMSELGSEGREYHRQIGSAIAMTTINKVLSIGCMSQLIGDLSGRGEHFQDKPSLIYRLTQLLSEHGVITVLVKGSRSAAMEQVVHALQERRTHHVSLVG